MQGKYGKNEWKIRIFVIIRIAVILAVITVLGFAGFSYMQKKQAEAEKTLQKQEDQREEIREEKIAKKQIEEKQIEEKQIEEKQIQTEQIKEETKKEKAEEPVIDEAVKKEADIHTNVQKIDKEAMDVSQTEPVSMDAVSSVSATSALSEYNMTHSPDRILDNDLSTAWVEGVSGNGEGESVIFMLNDTYRVSGITISAGYQKNSDLYSKNARPSQIELTFSNGETQKLDLSDQQSEQSVNLSAPVDTSSITVKIVSVYPGWKYTDTAITELTFY